MYSYKIYVCVCIYIYVKGERKSMTIKILFELIQSGKVQDTKLAYRTSILLATLTYNC